MNNETGKCVLLIGFGAVLGWGAATIWPFAPFESTKKDWVDVATALGTCAAVIAALATATVQLWLDARRRRVAHERVVLVKALEDAETELALANRLSWIVGDLAFYLRDLPKRIRNKRFSFSRAELDDWFQRCTNLERDEPSYEKLGDLFEVRRTARDTIAVLTRWDGIVPPDFQEQERIPELDRSLEKPMKRIFDNVHRCRSNRDNAASKLAAYDVRYVLLI